MTAPLIECRCNVASTLIHAGLWYVPGPALMKRTNLRLRLAQRDALHHSAATDLSTIDDSVVRRPASKRRASDHVASREIQVGVGKDGRCVLPPVWSRTLRLTALHYFCPRLVLLPMIAGRTGDLQEGRNVRAYLALTTERTELGRPRREHGRMKAH